MNPAPNDFNQSDQFRSIERRAKGIEIKACGIVRINPENIELNQGIGNRGETDQSKDVKGKGHPKRNETDIVRNDIGEEHLREPMSTLTLMALLDWHDATTVSMKQKQGETTKQQHQQRREKIKSS